MYKRTTMTGSGLVLAMTLMAFAPVGAGELEAQEPQTEATDVEDDELESFAIAYIEINQISREMTQRLQMTEDAEEQAEIQEEARAEMAEAVEEQDLTPRRYREIAAALNEDEELRDKFVEIVEEIQAGP